MTLNAQAETELRTSIVRGVLKPGTKLSEPELAERFSTSRSPIREALMVLEREGFVDRSDTGRIRVRELDIAEAEQLYDLRATLEAMAVKLAVENLRLKDINLLKDHLAAMKRAARAKQYLEAMEQGAAFHKTIGDQCGNEPLKECLEGLRARTSRYRYIVAAIDDFSEERINEHVAVLEAMKSHDAKRAEKEMYRHIVNSSKATLNSLRDYLASQEVSAG